MSRTAITGTQSVLEAAQQRVAWLFDNYERVQLSFSGGKDSTVLFHLINQEAQKRNRKFYLYFQDQEAEYQATIDFVEWCMTQPNVIPLWYQVPIFMTNAVSHEQMFLWAWGDNEQWIREKNPIAIHSIGERYPRRFHKFNLWVGQKLAKCGQSAVSVIGLRAEESPDRRHVLFGEDSDMFWVRRIKNPHKAYPIIDWSYTDVWKYLIDNDLKYNRIYDRMYMLGLNLRQMRVSNLIHEKSYRCLVDLQELEPETYDKLEQRLKGVHCAAIYAKENLVYSIQKLPEQFKSWYDYKEFLLNAIHPDLARIFRWQWTRFNDTHEEGACKYMVKRILLCDWEGNITSAKYTFGENCNYSKEQLKQKNYDKKNDPIVKKWFEYTS